MFLAQVVALLALLLTCGGLATSTLPPTTTTTTTANLWNTQRLQAIGNGLIAQENPIAGFLDAVELKAKIKEDSTKLK